MKVTQSVGISNVMKAYGKHVKRTTKAKEATDKVEISSAARDMQVARKAFDSLPEIREDKVADIKQQIASGTYKPSAEQVIEKLMSDVGL